jgi:SAM-dependent methyltransferase
MLRSNFYNEPLSELAVEAFEVAARHCGSCRDSHALWPYIRLSRASIGAERDGSTLEPLLAELLITDHPAILIAGTQDTGLLALVARAASKRAADIIVLDRCDTPLEMCRRLSTRWGLPISTIQQDLRDLDICDRFDLVLLHHTLQFVPTEDRRKVLLNLARALRPNGRLVHAFNISDPLSGPSATEHRNCYPDWVIQELSRGGVSFPEPRDAFRARLAAHAVNRERHTGPFSDMAEVDRLMHAAGFSVERTTSITPELITPYRLLIAKLNMQRIIKIAHLSV